MISAKILCDSVSPEGHRLTTFELYYPKFIHGEFMTHRVFSRNASSSRAIPISKNLQEVLGNDLRAEPVYWGKNAKGMGTTEELTGKALADAMQYWRFASFSAADWVSYCNEIGGAKEWVNRMLEPYLHITVVCTATEYMNFFGLRLDKAAQPEMRALAEAMWGKYNESTPDNLSPGDWHLPYVEPEDFNALGEEDGMCLGDRTESDAIKVSIARCARVSYKSYETGRKSTVEEDVALFNRLRESRHWSPFEHAGTPDTKVWLEVQPEYSEWRGAHKHQWGNFTGWRQLRKFLPYEAIAQLPREYR